MNKDHRWFTGSRDRVLTNLKSKSKTLNEKNKTSKIYKIKKYR